MPDRLLAGFDHISFSPVFALPPGTDVVIDGLAPLAAPRFNVAPGPTVDPRREPSMGEFHGEVVAAFESTTARPPTAAPPKGASAADDHIGAGPEFGSIDPPLNGRVGGTCAGLECCVSLPVGDDRIGANGWNAAWPGGPTLDAAKFELLLLPPGSDGPKIPGGRCCG